MSEWKEYKLGEVCSRLSSGKGIKSDSITTQGKYPVWGGNGVRGYTDTSNFSGRCCIIGRQGAYCGNVHFFEGDAYMTEHAVVAVGNELADSYFLACQLSLMHLENLSAQSAQPGISVKTLSTQTVCLPSIDTQRRIASILTSLDDKIDLLRRENATLEAMAETLFRQWFVEEAKEDWEEGIVSDLIEFNPTRKLAKGSIAPFLEMSNLSTSTYAPTYWYNRTFSSGSKFQNGDTLLARITPCLENGKTAYVDFLNENQIGWGSTEFIVMHSKLGIHPFFSYVIAKYQDFRDYAESCMSGSSGRQRVDVDNLKNYPINIPDKITIVQFNNEIETMVSKMNNNNKQIQTLIQTRDELLEKLMSNEINI